MAEIPGLHKLKELFGGERKTDLEKLVGRLEGSLDKMKFYLDHAYEADKKLVYRKHKIENRKDLETNPVAVELTVDDRVKVDFEPLFLTEIKFFLDSIKDYLRIEQKKMSGTEPFAVSEIYPAIFSSIEGKAYSEIPYILDKTYQKIFNLARN